MLTNKVRSEREFRNTNLHTDTHAHMWTHIHTLGLLLRRCTPNTPRGTNAAPSPADAKKLPSGNPRCMCEYVARMSMKMVLVSGESRGKGAFAYEICEEMPRIVIVSAQTTGPLSHFFLWFRHPFLGTGKSVDHELVVDGVWCFFARCLVVFDCSFRGFDCFFVVSTVFF